ncbi:MAG TPA: hypothetical protein PK559_05495 [Ignavibacteriaceae bacterium]|nr:hypothetical protein [Ignavibacteriaceae bacterium]
MSINSLTKLLGLLLLPLLFSAVSCNKPTEPNEQPINYPNEITVADAYCAELWINVNTNDNNLLNDTLILRTESKILLEFLTASSPKEIYINNLSPSNTFTLYLTDKQGRKRSNTLKVSTLDTTSSIYTWEKFQFGNGQASSLLYDVAIIDENNIWAVGEIHVNDSLGNYDPKIYNAVHWDGSKWEPKRILSSICGSTGTAVICIYAIYAFDSTNIYFSDGGELIHFDGQTYKQDCTVNQLLTGRINKIWGKSSSDLYVAGINGALVHYNGSSWTKLESGTTLDINDIHGANGEILCVAANVLGSFDLDILRIKNQNVDKLPKADMSSYMSGIWYDGHQKYYVAGGGIWKSYKDEIHWKTEPRTRTYYLIGIDGFGVNSIVGVGSFGEMLYYNGMNWRSLINETYLVSGDFFSVDINENMIAAVGWSNHYAVIMLGRK